MSEIPPNPNDASDDEVESSEAFLRPRRPADDEIDMTPMIDCVFLLLIFFIINFRADQAKSVPLPTAKYGNPVMGLDSVFLTVLAGEGNTAKIYKADLPDPAKMLRSSSLLDQEQEIIDYVEREIKAGKKQVVIKGDGNLTSGHIQQVAKAASKAIEGQPLHIAVMGTR
jgi:biopolymer transport protein ExbD